MLHNFLVTFLCLAFVFHHFLVLVDALDDLDDKVVIVQQRQGIDVGDHDVACKTKNIVSFSLYKKTVLFETSYAAIHANYCYFGCLDVSPMYLSFDFVIQHAATRAFVL